MSRTSEGPADQLPVVLPGGSKGTTPPCRPYHLCLACGNLGNQEKMGGLCGFVEAGLGFRISASTVASPLPLWLTYSRMPTVSSLQSVCEQPCPLWGPLRAAVNGPGPVPKEWAGSNLPAHPAQHHTHAKFSCVSFPCLLSETSLSSTSLSSQTQGVLC